MDKIVEGFTLLSRFSGILLRYSAASSDNTSFLSAGQTIPLGLETGVQERCSESIDPISSLTFVVLELSSAGVGVDNDEETVDFFVFELIGVFSAEPDARRFDFEGLFGVESSTDIFFP